MGLNVTWATAYSEGQFSFVASQTKKPMSKGAEEEGRSKEGMLLRGSWFPGQLIEGDGGVGRAAFHLINSPKIVSSRKFLEVFQSLQVPRVGLQVTNGARSSCELFLFPNRRRQPLAASHLTSSQLPMASISFPAVLANIAWWTPRRQLEVIIYISSSYVDLVKASLLD